MMKMTFVCCSFVHSHRQHAAFEPGRDHGPKPGCTRHSTETRTSSVEQDVKTFGAVQNDLNEGMPEEWIVFREFHQIL